MWSPEYTEYTTQTGFGIIGCDLAENVQLYIYLYIIYLYICIFLLIILIHSTPLDSNQVFGITHSIADSEGYTCTCT